MDFFETKIIACFSHILCFNVCVKDGIDYAEKNGMFFIETSAKTADNINELFEVLLMFASFQSYSMLNLVMKFCIWQE